VISVAHIPLRTLAAGCVLAGLMCVAGCASKTTTPPGATPAVSRETRSPVTRKTASILRTARSQLGVRYKWGGNSPRTGFDCSGFAWYVFRQNGVDIPRISWQQFGAGRPVKFRDLRPGDLIFHKVEKKGKSLHVGIVSDRGTFYHSPSSGKRVMESRLTNPYWRKHFVGARRVL
jgi:cell wall-associated NlpC family hydrolase